MEELFEVSPDYPFRQMNRILWGKDVERSYPLDSPSPWPEYKADMSVSSQNARNMSLIHVKNLHKRTGQSLYQKLYSYFKKRPRDDTVPLEEGHKYPKRAEHSPRVAVSAAKETAEVRGREQAPMYHQHDLLTKPFRHRRSKSHRICSTYRRMARSKDFARNCKNPNDKGRIWRQRISRPLVVSKQCATGWDRSRQQRWSWKCRTKK